MNTKLNILLVAFLAISLVSCKQNAADKIEDADAAYRQRKSPFG
jgi:hypothetical protein